MLIRVIIFLSVLCLNQNCLSLTDAYHENTDLDFFYSKNKQPIPDCTNQFLQKSLYLNLKNFLEYECNIPVYGAEYKFTWKKTDTRNYSFITPLREISNLGLIPVSFLAWIGLIPNYEERKINIAAKVYSSKGLLWEKDYYNYYEIWTSLLLLPAVPIEIYRFKNGSTVDKTLYTITESMVADFRLRGILEK